MMLREPPTPEAMEHMQLCYQLLFAADFRRVVRVNTASLWVGKDGRSCMLSVAGDGMPLITRLDERRI